MCFPELQFEDLSLRAPCDGKNPLEKVDALIFWVEGERLGGVDLFFGDQRLVDGRISPPKRRKVITKAT